MYRILLIGPQWRGSNAAAMFNAFSRLGHLINVVDENYYLNFSSSSIYTRLINKLTRKLFINDFNRAIIKQFNLFDPDFVIVYKGAFIQSETLHYIHTKKKKVFNFYPDVSFFTHGSLIPQTITQYDHVFTTKTFGITDLKEKFNYQKSSFIPHGFDPLIHKKIKHSLPDLCDVSFIGTYSSGKYDSLLAVADKNPNINLKIWGGAWSKHVTNEKMVPFIMNTQVIGDVYALTIQRSKINLGLLSEKVHGASSGDLITSRTFHIPASYGFMIHKRTPEISNYFEENKEIICFESNEELVDKVKYYLNHDQERKEITEQGYNRCIKQHTIDKRAEQVLIKISEFL